MTRKTKNFLLYKHERRVSPLGERIQKNFLKVSKKTGKILSQTRGWLFRDGRPVNRTYRELYLIG